MHWLFFCVWWQRGGEFSDSSRTATHLQRTIRVRQDGCDDGRERGEGGSGHALLSVRRVQDDPKHEWRLLPGAWMQEGTAARQCVLQHTYQHREHERRAHTLGDIHCPPAIPAATSRAPIHGPVTHRVRAEVIPGKKLAMADASLMATLSSPSVSIAAILQCMGGKPLWARFAPAWDGHDSVARMRKPSNLTLVFAS